MAQSFRDAARWTTIALVMLCMGGTCNQQKGPGLKPFALIACSPGDASTCLGTKRPTCADNSDTDGNVRCVNAVCYYTPDPNNADCKCVERDTDSCDAGVRTCVASKSGGVGLGNEAADWGPCVSSTPVDAGGGTNTTTVVVECTAGSTRDCKGPDGCGGGTESCGGDNKWNGQCTNARVKSCPAGWGAENGTCKRAGEATMNMYDGAGGDGYNFGRVSVDFPLYDAVVTGSVNVTRASGGCFNSETPDGVLIFCEKLSSRNLTQCESGAPDWNKKSCPGTTIDNVGAWCELHKIKGWTPIGQGTCNKRATLSYTASTAPRCSW